MFKKLIKKIKDKMLQRKYLKFADGAIVKEDPRDYMYAAAVPYDLKYIVAELEQPEFRIPYTPKKIYDQGQTPMCVGFSSKRTKEIQEYNESGAVGEMSAGFIYLNRVSRDLSYAMNASGMIIREALSHICNEGVLLEQDFSWHGDWKNIGQFEKEQIASRTWPKITPEMWTKAYPNKGREYAKLLTDEDIQVALVQEKCGVIFNIPITSKFIGGYNEQITAEWAKTNARGYHAVLCEGWTTHEGQKYFVVPNSWSDQWGSYGGYCFLPFGYPIVEAYVLFDHIAKPKYWRVQCGNFTDKNAIGISVMTSKLKNLGFDTYTTKVDTEEGERWRVQIGAYKYKITAAVMEKKLRQYPLAERFFAPIFNIYY